MKHPTLAWPVLLGLLAVACSSGGGGGGTQEPPTGSQDLKGDWRITLQLVSGSGYPECDGPTGLEDFAATFEVCTQCPGVEPGWTLYRIDKHGLAEGDFVAAHDYVNEFLLLDGTFYDSSLDLSFDFNATTLPDGSVSSQAFSLRGDIEIYAGNQVIYTEEDGYEIDPDAELLCEGTIEVHGERDQALGDQSLVCGGRDYAGTWQVSNTLAVPIEFSVDPLGRALRARFEGPLAQGQTLGPIELLTPIGADGSFDLVMYGDPGERAIELSGRLHAGGHLVGHLAARSDGDLRLIRAGRFLALRL